MVKTSTGPPDSAEVVTTSSHVTNSKQEQSKQPPKQPPQPQPSQQGQPTKSGTKKFLPSLLSRAKGDGAKGGRLKIPFVISTSNKQRASAGGAAARLELSGPPTEAINDPIKQRNKGNDSNSITNRSSSGNESSSKISSLTDPFDDIQKRRLYGTHHQHHGGMMVIPLNPVPPVQNIIATIPNESNGPTDLSTISGSTYYNNYAHGKQQQQQQQQQQQNQQIQRQQVVLQQQQQRQDQQKKAEKSMNSNLRAPDLESRDPVAATSQPNDKASERATKDTLTQLSTVSASTAAAHQPTQSTPRVMELNNGLKIEAPFPMSLDKVVISSGKEIHLNMTNTSKTIPKEDNPSTAVDATGIVLSSQRDLTGTGKSSTEPPVPNKKREFDKVKALLDRVHQNTHPPVVASTSTSTNNNNSSFVLSNASKNSTRISSNISHQDSKSVAMEQSVTTEVIANGYTAARRQAAAAAAALQQRRGGRKQPPPLSRTVSSGTAGARMGTAATTEQTESPSGAVANDTKNHIFSSTIAEADNDDEEDDDDDEEDEINDVEGEDNLQEKDDPSSITSHSNRDESSTSSVSIKEEQAQQKTTIEEKKTIPTGVQRNFGSNILIGAQEQQAVRSMIPPRPPQRKPLEPPEQDFSKGSSKKTDTRRLSVDAPEAQPAKNDGNFNQSIPNSTENTSPTFSITSVNGYHNIIESNCPEGIKGNTLLVVSGVDNLSVADGSVKHPIQGIDVIETQIVGQEIRRPIDPDDRPIENNAESYNLLPTPTGIIKSNISASSVPKKSDPEDGGPKIQASASTVYGRIQVQPGTDIIIPVTAVNAPKGSVPIVQAIDASMSMLSEPPVLGSEKEEPLEAIPTRIGTDMDGGVEGQMKGVLSTISTDIGTTDAQNVNGTKTIPVATNSTEIPRKGIDKTNSPEIIDLNDPFGYFLPKNGKSKEKSKKLRSNPFETTDDDDDDVRKINNPKVPFTMQQAYDEMSDEDSIPVPPSFDQSIANSKILPTLNRRKKKGISPNSATSSRKKQSSPRRNSIRQKPTNSTASSPLVDRVNQNLSFKKKPPSGKTIVNDIDVGEYKQHKTQELIPPLVKANSYFEIPSPQGTHSIKVVDLLNAASVPSALPIEIAMSGEDPVSDLDQSFRHFPLKHVAADGSVDVSALDQTRYVSDMENADDDDDDDDFASIRRTSLFKPSGSLDDQGTDDNLYDRYATTNRHYHPQLFQGHSNSNRKIIEDMIDPFSRNNHYYRNDENTIPSVALADSVTGEWTLDQRESKDTLDDRRGRGSNSIAQAKSELHLDQHVSHRASHHDEQQIFLQHGQDATDDFQSTDLKSGNPKPIDGGCSGYGRAALAVTLTPLVCASHVAQSIMKGSEKTESSQSMNNTTLFENYVEKGNVNFEDFKGGLGYRPYKKPPITKTNDFQGRTNETNGGSVYPKTPLISNATKEDFVVTQNQTLNSIVSSPTDDYEDAFQIIAFEDNALASNVELGRRFHSSPIRNRNDHERRQDRVVSPGVLKHSTTPYFFTEKEMTGRSDTHEKGNDLLQHEQKTAQDPQGIEPYNYRRVLSNIPSPDDTLKAISSQSFEDNGPDRYEIVENPPESRTVNNECRENLLSPSACSLYDDANLERVEYEKHLGERKSEGKNSSIIKTLWNSGLNALGLSPKKFPNENPIGHNSSTVSISNTNQIELLTEQPQAKATTLVTSVELTNEISSPVVKEDDAIGQEENNHMEALSFRFSPKHTTRFAAYPRSNGQQPSSKTDYEMFKKQLEERIKTLRPTPRNREWKDSVMAEDRARDRYESFHELSPREDDTGSPNDRTHLANFIGGDQKIHVESSHHKTQRSITNFVDELRSENGLIDLTKIASFDSHQEGSIQKETIAGPQIEESCSMLSNECGNRNDVLWTSANDRYLTIGGPLIVVEGKEVIPLQNNQRMVGSKGHLERQETLQESDINNATNYIPVDVSFEFNDSVSPRAVSQRVALIKSQPLTEFQHKEFLTNSMIVVDGEEIQTVSENFESVHPLKENLISFRDEVDRYTVSSVISGSNRISLRNRRSSLEETCSDLSALEFTSSDVQNFNAVELNKSNSFMPDADGFTNYNKDYIWSPSESSKENIVEEYEDELRDVPTSTSSLSVANIRSSDQNAKLNNGNGIEHDSNSSAIAKIVALLSFPTWKSSQDGVDLVGLDSLMKSHDFDNRSTSADFPPMETISNPSNLKGIDQVAEFEQNPSPSNDKSHYQSPAHSFVEESECLSLTNKESAHFSKVLSDDSTFDFGGFISNAKPGQQDVLISDGSYGVVSKQGAKDTLDAPIPVATHPSAFQEYIAVCKDVTRSHSPDANIDKNKGIINPSNGSSNNTATVSDVTEEPLRSIKEAETSGRVDRLLAKYTKMNPKDDKKEQIEESHDCESATEIKTAKFAHSQNEVNVDDRIDDALLAICRGTEILICGQNEFELVHSETKIGLKASEAKDILQSKTAQAQRYDSTQNETDKRADCTFTRSSDADYLQTSLRSSGPQGGKSFENNADKNETSSIVGQGSFSTAADLSTLLRKVSKEIPSRRSGTFYGAFQKKEQLTPMSDLTTRRDFLDYLFEGTESLLCGPLPVAPQTASKARKTRENRGSTSKQGLDKDFLYGKTKNASDSNDDQGTVTSRASTSSMVDENNLVSKRTETTISGPDLEQVRRFMELARSDTSSDSNASRSLITDDENTSKNSDVLYSNFTDFEHIETHNGFGTTENEEQSLTENIVNYESTEEPNFVTDNAATQKLANSAAKDTESLQEKEITILGMAATATIDPNAATKSCHTPPAFEKLKIEDEVHKDINDNDNTTHVEREITNQTNCSDERGEMIVSSDSCHPTNDSSFCTNERKSKEVGETGQSQLNVSHRDQVAWREGTSLEEEVDCDDQPYLTEATHEIAYSDGDVGPSEAKIRCDEKTHSNGNILAHEIDGTHYSTLNQSDDKHFSDGGAKNGICDTEYVEITENRDEYSSVEPVTKSADETLYGTSFKGMGTQERIAIQTPKRRKAPMPEILSRDPGRRKLAPPIPEMIRNERGLSHVDTQSFDVLETRKSVNLDDLHETNALESPNFDDSSVFNEPTYQTVVQTGFDEILNEADTQINDWKIACDSSGTEIMTKCVSSDCAHLELSPSLVRPRNTAISPLSVQNSFSMDASDDDAENDSTRHQSLMMKPKHLEISDNDAVYATNETGPLIAMEINREENHETIQVAEESVDLDNASHHSSQQHASESTHLSGRNEVLCSPTVQCSDASSSEMQLDSMAIELSKNVLSGTNESNPFQHQNSKSDQIDNAQHGGFNGKETESFRNEDNDVVTDQRIAKEYKYSYVDPVDGVSSSSEIQDENKKHVDENITSINVQRSCLNNATSQAEERQQTEGSYVDPVGGGSTSSEIQEKNEKHANENITSIKVQRSYLDNATSQAEECQQTERSPVSKGSPIVEFTEERLSRESPLNERNVLTQKSRNLLESYCQEETQSRRCSPRDSTLNVPMNADETKHSSMQQIINGSKIIIDRKPSYNEIDFGIRNLALDSEPFGEKSKAFGTPVVAGFDIGDYFIPVVQSTSIPLTDVPLLSPIIKGEKVSIPFFDNDNDDTKNQNRTRDADSFYAQIVDKNFVKNELWMKNESRMRSEIDPLKENGQDSHFETKVVADEVNEIESAREGTTVLHLLSDNGFSIKSQEESIFGNFAPPLSGSFGCFSHSSPSEKSSLLNGASTLTDVQGYHSYDNIAKTFSMTESINHPLFTNTVEETLGSASNSFQDTDLKAQSDINQSVAPTFSMTPSNIYDNTVAKLNDDATNATLPQSLMSQDDNFGRVATNANIEVAQTFSSLSCNRKSDRAPSLFLSISDEVYSNLECRAAVDSDDISNGTDIVVEKSEISNAQRQFHLNSPSHSSVNDQRETSPNRSEVGVAPLLTLQSSGIFELSSQSIPLGSNLILRYSESATNSGDCASLENPCQTENYNKNEPDGCNPSDCNNDSFANGCIPNDKQKLVAPGVDVLVVEGMIVEPDRQLSPLYKEDTLKNLNDMDGKAISMGRDVASDGNRESRKTGSTISNVQVTNNGDEELEICHNLPGQSQNLKIVIQEIEPDDELEIESKGNTVGDFGVILRTLFCGDLAAVPSSEKQETKSEQEVCWSPFSKKANDVPQIESHSSVNQHEVKTEQAAYFIFASSSKTDSPQATDREQVGILKRVGQSFVETNNQLMNTPKSGNVGYSPRSRPERSIENVSETFVTTTVSHNSRVKGINLIDDYSDSMSTNHSEANEGIVSLRVFPKASSSNESEVCEDTKSNLSKNKTSQADEKTKDQSESTWDPSTIESQSMQSRALLGSIQESPVVPLEISVTTASTIQQDCPVSYVQQQQLKPVASMEYSGTESESTETSESDYSSEKPEIPLEIAFEGGLSTIVKPVDSVLSVLSHVTTASESLEITTSFEKPLYPSSSDDILGVVQKMKSQHGEQLLKRLETPTSNEIFEEVTAIDINETTPTFSFERNDTSNSLGDAAKPRTGSGNLTPVPLMPISSDTLDVKALLTRYDKIVQNIAALDEHKRNLNDERKVEGLIEMPENEYRSPTTGTQTEYFGEEAILLPSESPNTSIDRMESKSGSFVSKDLIDLTSAVSAPTSLENVDSTLIRERIPGSSRIMKQHEIDAKSIGTDGPAVEVRHLQNRTVPSSMESPSTTNQRNLLHNFSSTDGNSATRSARIRIENTPTSVITTQDSSKKSGTRNYFLESADTVVESEYGSNAQPSISTQQFVMTSLSGVTPSGTTDLKEQDQSHRKPGSPDNDENDSTSRLPVTKGGNSLQVRSGISKNPSFTNSSVLSEAKSKDRLKKSSSTQSKQSQEIGDLFSRYDQIVQQMVILDKNRFELAKSKQLMHYSNGATRIITDVHIQPQNKNPVDTISTTVHEVGNNSIPCIESTKPNQKSTRVTEASILPIVETRNTNLSLQSAKNRLSARSQRSFLSLPNRRSRKGYHLVDAEKKDSSMVSMPNSAQVLLSENSKRSHDAATKSASSDLHRSQVKIRAGDSQSETSKQAGDRLTNELFIMGQSIDTKQQLTSPSSSTKAVALSSSFVGTQRATELHKTFIEKEAEDAYETTSVASLTQIHSPTNSNGSSIDIFTKFDKLLMARMDCSTYQPGESRNDNDQVQGKSSIVSILSDGHVAALVENKKLHALARETVNLPNIAISSPTLSNVSSFVHVNVRSLSPTLSDTTIDRRADTVVSPSSRFQDRENHGLDPTEDAQKHRSFSGMHSRRAGWVHQEQDVSDENDSPKMVALTKVEVSKNEEPNQKVEFIFESIPHHDEQDDDIFHALSDTTATEGEIQMEYSEDELHPPPPQTEAIMQGLQEHKGIASLELDNIINKMRTDEGDDAMSSPRYVFSSSYSNSSYEDSEVQMQQIESIIHGLRSAEGDMSSPRSGWSLSNNSPRSNFGGSQRGSESVTASSLSNQISQASPRKKS